MINQSIPVNYVMKKDNLVTFNTEDFTDDIQDVMINTAIVHSLLSISGENVWEPFPDEISLTCTKQIVLVDHNRRTGC